MRSERASILQIGLTSNLPMLGALATALLLQMAVIYVPAFNSIFHTQPLPLFDLLLCLALYSLVGFAVEVEKWLIPKSLIYQLKSAP